MLAIALFWACLQLAVGLPFGDESVDFTKYKVIKIVPKDGQNVQTLRNLIHDFQVTLVLNSNLLMNTFLTRNRLIFGTDPKKT